MLLSAWLDEQDSELITRLLALVDLPAALLAALAGGDGEMLDAALAALTDAERERTLAGLQRAGVRPDEGVSQA